MKLKSIKSWLAALSVAVVAGVLAGGQQTARADTSFYANGGLISIAQGPARPYRVDKVAKHNFWNAFPGVQIAQAHGCETGWYRAFAIGDKHLFYQKSRFSQADANAKVLKQAYNKAKLWLPWSGKDDGTIRAEQYKLW
jgi:hypothetical protein